MEIGARIEADLVVLGAALPGDAAIAAALAPLAAARPLALGGRAAHAGGRGRCASARLLPDDVVAAADALSAPARWPPEPPRRPAASIRRMSPAFAHTCLRVVDPAASERFYGAARLRAPRAAELRRAPTTSTWACRAAATSSSSR